MAQAHTDVHRPRAGCRVVLLDPNANTPPYDRALAAALARAGCHVTLATSRFLYERLSRPSGYRLDESFFRLAGGPLGERLGLRSGRPPAARARRALKLAEYPLNWASLLGRLGRYRPDVLHVQWSVLPALDRRIWRRVQRLGIPIVYTAHNLAPHDGSTRAADAFGALYRAADVLIVHTARSKAALAARWAIDPERIQVAPHGPLLEEEPDVGREAARARLGLPRDVPVVLFAGLIEPYKGLDDLIRAFARVADVLTDARLIIAGKPNVPLSQIEHALAKLGLRSRTVLDARFLPQAELAAYLCAADVVALPYRDTTSSGLFHAARRFEKAVVATAVGDLAELIADCESGLLVPPRDPAALASALGRLLSDRALADQMGASGRSTARAEGGWDEAARQTLAAYEAARRVLAASDAVSHSTRRRPN